MKPLEKMPKRKPKTEKSEKENELWISPRFSLKGVDGERAWDNRPTSPPNSNRFLELADIALGLKKPTPRKAKSTSVRDTIKREPYKS